MLLVEIPGIVRTYHYPYSGIVTEGQTNIIKVFPESPAGQSGLKKGDTILKINGIDLEDIKTLSRQPIKKIGDERIYTIQRDDVVFEASIIFSRMPSRDLILCFAGTFVGLFIIIFCLVPYFKIQTRNTLLLAIAGLGLGFSFLDLPEFSLLSLRILSSAIWTIIVFWGLASCLHFMISYPRPKKILSKKYTIVLLYGCPGLVFLFFLVFNIFRPDATHVMRTLSRVLYNGLMALYFILSLIALIHSYVGSSLEEREKSKLNFAFWGFVVGILPSLISYISFTFFPNVILPGSDFYFLFLIIIPVAIALSVLKTEGPE